MRLFQERTENEKNGRSRGGMPCDIPFHGYDHGNNCAGDYGLTYNLMIPNKVWAPQEIAPRPVVPALSAASCIVEGHKSNGAIKYFGETVLGYSYSDRDDHTVFALRN